jgi:hypothetical protein
MQSIQDQIDAGLAASRAGQHLAAQRWFEGVLQHDPYHPVAWLELSKLMPTAEQALRCVEQVLHQHPHNPQALEHKAMLQMRLLVEESAIVENAVAVASSLERRYLLGEALLAVNILTQQQLDNALKEQVRLAQNGQSQRLGDILLRQRLIQPDQLAAALASQIAVLSTTIKDQGTGLIGSFLLRHAFITNEQLQQALARQVELRLQGRSMLLGEVLVDSGILSRDSLNHALIGWQQWYQRAATTRDDPYIATKIIPLRTRRKIWGQAWLDRITNSKSSRSRSTREE